MRTKTCKAITNHLLNGGRFNNYKGDIVLADGTTLTYADWMGKNTAPEQIDRWVCYSYQNDQMKLKPMSLYTISENYFNFLKYLFPFLNTFSTITNKPSATSAFQYSYRVSGNYKHRSPGESYIFFGSDNTEESENDYALKSGFDDVALISVNYGSTYESYVALSVKNWKDEAVTIKELGSFVDITSSTKSPVDESLSASNMIMLARLVLDAPVTIAAGETGQIYLK